ncbi:MAG: cellulase family glycosylhydrolase [Oscillospiraceae bacterium]|nr:cellulase family glycosylhydrolase [Oscillospiraceae bacterium]
MKKQKIICAALAAALIAGSFAGCKDKDTAGDNTTAENPSSTAAETEAEVETSSPKVSVEGTKFMVDGKELYINGVNTPWENWNDFGGNFDPEFWDFHFADLHDIGVNSVRVWINCASMVSIKLRKETGEVYKVTDEHWQHVDKLFEIAEKHQIYLMPTLLSFDHFKSTDSADRWRMMATDDTAMQSYIDMYVKPFTERYGANPYLLGIDLMNEPDWVHENEECGKLPLEDLSKFFAKCTAAIHETNPDTLVTVGIGMIKYNSDNEKYDRNIVSDEVMKSYGGENACLDFYSPHYYNWMKGWMGCAYDMSPTDFGLDGTKPMFIGETSAEGGETLAEAYEKCYNNGWNGVMMWMSNDGANHAANWADIEEATKKIEELIPEKVFPIGKK